MKHLRTDLGQQGETAAVQFLLQRGYRILARNWRCKQGELDIIAQEGETLVFVEVRQRLSRTTATAFETIDTRKRKRLLDAVHEYLAVHDAEEVLWRVDVIAIARSPDGLLRIEHVENALDW